jgi:hypothetical protein
VTAGELLILLQKISEKPERMKEAYRTGLLLLSIFMGWLVYVDSLIDLKLEGKNSFTLALSIVTLPPQTSSLPAALRIRWIRTVKLVSLLDPDTLYEIRIRGSGFVRKNLDPYHFIKESKKFPEKSLIFYFKKFHDLLPMRQHIFSMAPKMSR